MGRLAELGERVLAGYRDALRDEDFSGAVMIAGDGDEEPATFALGLADRAAGRPNTVDTRFGTASTTKLITGLAVARLVDRGVISYDARIRDLVAAELLPSTVDEAVTLGDLLSHRSGIGDYADDHDGPPYESIWLDVPPGTIRRPRDLMPLIRDVPPRAAPGVEVRYNNAAYVLVGLALEAVTGSDYAGIVEHEVFAPLLMTRSGFWALDGLEPDLAVGYLPPDPAGELGLPRTEWQTNVHAIPVIGQPDGGAQSTVADLARLLDGLIGRGPEGSGYLTDTTRAAMLGPYATDPRTGGRYGFGVVHAGAADGRRLGHGGDDPGFACRAYAYPAAGLRIVVLSNVSEGAGPAFRRLDALVTGSQL